LNILAVVLNRHLMVSFPSADGHVPTQAQIALPRSERPYAVARYYQLENKVQAAVSYELAAEIPVVK